MVIELYFELWYNHGFGHDYDYNHSGPWYQCLKQYVSTVVLL